AVLDLDLKIARFVPDLDYLMASTRQCLVNQFADLSVCAKQNKFHKNSILVSDLRIYLFTFNLGGQSASSVEHLPSNPASVGRGEERDYIGDLRLSFRAAPAACAQTIPFTASSPIRAVAALSIAVSTRPGATAFTVTPPETQFRRP